MTRSESEVTVIDLNLAGRHSHPFFSQNKLKLAVFGANVSHGCSMTFVDGTINDRKKLLGSVL